jgi:hypothetical protein
VDGVEHIILREDEVLGCSSQEQRPWPPKTSF